MNEQNKKAALEAFQKIDQMIGWKHRIGFSDLHELEEGFTSALEGTLKAYVELAYEIAVQDIVDLAAHMMGLQAELNLIKQRERAEDKQCDCLGQKASETK